MTLYTFFKIKELEKEESQLNYLDFVSAISRSFHMTQANFLKTVNAGKIIFHLEHNLLQGTKIVNKILLNPILPRGANMTPPSGFLKFFF